MVWLISVKYETLYLQIVINNIWDAESFDILLLLFQQGRWFVFVSRGFILHSFNIVSMHLFDTLITYIYVVFFMMVKLLCGFFFSLIRFECLLLIICLNVPLHMLCRFLWMEQGTCIFYLGFLRVVFICLSTNLRCQGMGISYLFFKGRFHTCSPI